MIQVANHHPVSLKKPVGKCNAMTIDDYRNKLMRKIIGAHTKQNVHRFVNTAVSSLVRNKVHGHIVARFIDKTLTDLQRTELDTAMPGKPANCEAAKELLKQIRKRINEGKTA